MTDQEMTHVIKKVLDDTGYLSLRSARFTFEKGVVELRGQVHSFYIKQIAQEVLLRISGVTQVINSVEVSDTRFV